MASWGSANLANLLPADVDSLLDSTRDLLETVRTPLELISDVLEVVKTIFASLRIFDFVGALADSIESLKSSFLVSGLYVCDMWNYPYKQLTSVADYGPDQTYDKLNFDGHEFRTSFLADLLASFDDSYDTNRPMFSRDVAALILVKADPVIENLGLSAEENNIADAFPGMAQSIGSAVRNIKLTRFKAMLGKFKAAAELQPRDKVSVRVERIVDAFNTVNQLDDQTLSLLPVPEDYDNESFFFENKPYSNLNWDTDIRPILESIEDTVSNSVYPDWNRASLQDIYPGLKEIVDQVFDPVIELLRSGSGMQGQIITFIESIKSKVEELETIIDKIDDIIDQIERLINITGFHALYVQSSSGITDLKAKISAATNIPFTGKSFYAGMAILAGSDSITAFNALFSLVVSS